MSAFLTPLPQTVTGVALLVVIFYSVGAWCRGRWWILGWAVAALGTVAMEAVSPSSDQESGGDDSWIVLLWTVGAVAVGRITAGWQDRVRRTEAVVDALERGRGAAVRLAVAQEREVLAGQLHDTVAHAMTVVCLQAGAQPAERREPRRRACELIASMAEQSLVELRDGLDAIESARNPLDRARIAALGRRLGVDLRGGVRRTPAPDRPGGSRAPGRPRGRRQRRPARARRNGRRVGPPIRERPVRRGRRRRQPRAGSAARHGQRPRGLAETVESAGGTLEWGTASRGASGSAALIPQEARMTIDPAG